MAPRQRKAAVPDSPPRPSDEELGRLVGGAHHSPHDVLGGSLLPDGLLVRVLRPGAERVTLLIGGDEHPMTHVRDGLFDVVVPGLDQIPDYRLRVSYGDREFLADDPYRFLPTLGEIDLHLAQEGRHERLWTVLGAHVRRYESSSAAPGSPDGAVVGTSFAVWAPNARGVRVAGSFNYWDSRAHPMRSLGSSGIWELFVPGVGAGQHYKFHVLGADSQWREKADPFAFEADVPPANASVVTDSRYVWNDREWLTRRAAGTPYREPMSVYEVHLGSWRQGLSYRELADQLVGYVRETGFTHVEFMPVAEHPFGGSWGYQVSSYYAPTARYGSPDDFRYLVDQFHQAGIGVIVDWVPAHFPRDAWALANFDGTALYEHADPRRGEQKDWGTLVFDFGRREVRNFLVANALYWIEEFHIDGLRVDAVASMLYLDYSRADGEWLPNVYGGRENLDAVDFLKELNATVYKTHPGAVTIAEESTAWPGVSQPTHLGGLGFGFKWNMGWMHDSLDYVHREPIYRRFHHHQLTFSLMYAFSENFVLPISHDEVVHGKGSLLNKMPGDRWQQFANLRAFLAFQWAHPGKQLLFMGSEFGQDAEWNHDDSLQWWLLDHTEHRGVRSVVADLNRIYREHPALWTRDSEGSGFQWIDANDAGNNTFSFLRWGDGPGGRSGGDSGEENVIACVTNFAGVPQNDYRIGLPFEGEWVELLNTDAEMYGGSGVGNLGSVFAEDRPHHGQAASATLRVPPLGTLWLARAR